MEKFEEDLDLLQLSLNDGLSGGARRRLDDLKSRLIQLRRKNIIKINHSAMELVGAKYLLLENYDVDVERQLTENLVCDLYAVKENEILIVEIETGFVPPENALDPLAYYEARIASKIARYSAHSNKFGLGTPPHHILNFLSILLQPPRERSLDVIKELKKKCDKYYRNPPVTIEELKQGFLDSIYVINVDSAKVKELDPVDYLEKYQLII